MTGTKQTEPATGPEPAFRLYDYVLSGNCYKIRLFAALLGLSYEAQAVDFYPGFEHRSAAMLALNPAGTLPVMETLSPSGAGVQVLTETNDMLIWMAQTSPARAAAWYPQHSQATRAAMQDALALSRRLTQSVGLARLQAMLDWPVDGAAKQAEGLADLRRLELALSHRQLEGCCWLVGEGPSLADIACFPYAALSPDAGLDHDGFPAIREWLYQVRRLPGFITMPGIHALHELRKVD